jgi:hypothetical protein
MSFPKCIEFTFLRHDALCNKCTCRCNVPGIWFPWCANKYWQYFRSGSFPLFADPKILIDKGVWLFIKFSIKEGMVTSMKYLMAAIKGLWQKRLAKSDVGEGKVARQEIPNRKATSRFLSMP